MQNFKLLTFALGLNVVGFLSGDEISSIHDPGKHFFMLLQNPIFPSHSICFREGCCQPIECVNSRRMPLLWGHTLLAYGLVESRCFCAKKRHPFLQDWKSTLLGFLAGYLCTVSKLASMHSGPTFKYFLAVVYKCEILKE